MNARSLILALAAGLAWSVGPVAKAQQPPSSQVLSMSSTSDAGARKAIRDFIEPHMKAIASGAPTKVEESRKALAQVLRKPECTLAFNVAFLDEIKPSVESVLKSGDGYRGMNALLVVRQIRCPEALDFVLAQCDPAKQDDLRTRIAASGMLGAMIRGGAVPANQLDNVGRRLRETLESETSALAASQLVDGLGAVGSVAQGAKLPVQVRSAIEELVKTTNTSIDRASKPDTADFAMVVYRGLITMRDLIVDLPADQKPVVGRTLSPLFARIQQMPAGKAGSEAAREVKAAKDALPGLQAMVGLAKPEPAKK